MTYPNLNASNTQGLFQYVEQIVPSFSAWLIGAFWFIIFLFSYYSAIKMGRNPNAPVSVTAASFGAVILAVVLTMIPGFVPQTVLMVTFGIFAASVIWLMFSNRED